MPASRGQGRNPSSNRLSLEETKQGASWLAGRKPPVGLGPAHPRVSKPCASRCRVWASASGTPAQTVKAATPRGPQLSEEQPPLWTGLTFSRSCRRGRRRGKRSSLALASRAWNRVCQGRSGRHIQIKLAVLNNADATGDQHRGRDVLWHCARAA